MITLKKMKCTRSLWRRQHHFLTIRIFVLTSGTLLIGIVGLVHFPVAEVVGDAGGSVQAFYYALNACDRFQSRFELFEL